MAEQAGTTRTKYAAIERGQTASMTRADAEMLAAVFGVEEQQVLVGQAPARAAFVGRLR